MSGARTVYFVDNVVRTFVVYLLVVVDIYSMHVF